MTSEDYQNEENFNKKHETILHNSMQINLKT